LAVEVDRNDCFDRPIHARSTDFLPSAKARHHFGHKPWQLSG
jgi:hypothetical protein